MKNKGFTLMELLGTIVVLGIVISIVIVTVVSSINKSKEKTYGITENNILNTALAFAKEDNKKFYKETPSSKKEFVCVTVQDLIDSGFFKKDIIESKVKNGVQVTPEMSTYIERDADTKVFSNPHLITDSSDEFYNICVKVIEQECPKFNSYVGVYDGYAHTIGSNTNKKNIFYRTATEGEGSEWVQEKPERTEVGITNVYIRLKLDDNKEKICETKQISIQRKEIDEPTCASITYDENEHVLLLAREESVADSNGYWNEEIKGTNAGNYTTTLHLNENYKWSMGSDINNSRTKICTIEKSNTTTSLTSLTKEYNGEVQNASGATSKLENNKNLTNGSYTYYYYNSINECTSNGNRTTTPPKEVGTYYVIVNLLESNNYKKSSSTCTSYKMEQRKITIKANEQSITMGESINTGIDQITITEGSLGTDDKIASITLTNTNDIITPSNIKIVNESNKDVTSNYDIKYETGSLEMNKTEVIPILNKCNNKTYDGNTTATCEFNLQGVTAGEDVTATGTCNFDNKHVGTNKKVSCENIVLSGNDKNGYVLSTTRTSKDNAASITAKEITVKAANKTITYGETVPDLVENITVSGLVSGDRATDINLTESTTNYTTNGQITPSGLVVKDNNDTNVSNNYKVEYNSGSLTVNKKEISANISSCTTKTYDGLTKVTCELSLTGLINNDKPSASSTNCNATNANAGTDKTVTCSSVTLSGSDNYKLISSNITKDKIVTINKAPLQVKADNKSIPYGSSNPGYSYTATGLVNGETTNVLTGPASYKLKNGSTEVTNVSTINVGTYTIEVSGLSTSNYNISYTNGSLTIERSKTAKPGSCNTLTYNGNNQTLAANGEHITYQDNSGKDAKSYTVKAISDNNYAFSDGSLTKDLVCVISKKSLTITANNNSMAYGNSAPTYTYKVEGLISGDSLSGTAKYTIKNGSTEITNVSQANVGIYDIHVSGMSGDNYTITYEKGTLTINKSNTAATGSCKSLTYNGNNQTLTENGSYVSYSVNTGKDAKEYNITVTSDNNHTFSDGNTVKSLTCTINKKSLTITADNKAMNYGDSAPNYTYTSSGLLSGDSITGTAKYTIKNGSTEITNVSTANEGTYDIYVSNLSATNYEITYVKGTLKITNNSVSPTASCNNKTYDGTTSATCTISLTGVKAGDTVTASATSCKFADKNVGTNKTVTCTGISLSGADSSKYELTATSKTDTANITAKALTITAADKTMTYGDNASTYTYTSSGLLSGDTITGTATYTIKKGTTEITNIKTANIGTYDLYVSGLEATNYTITYVKGTLTITNKQDATTGSCNTLTYNGTNQTLASGGSYVSYSNNTATSAGTHKVTVTANANHAFSGGKTTDELECTISKKALTITAADKTMTYGDNAPIYTYTSSGLLSGDTITGTATYTIKKGTTEITNIKTANVGTYDIYVSGLEVTNYTITYVKGTLTITNKQDATTGSCNTLTYNGTNQTLASGGTNSSYSNNTAKSAGTHKVTVTANANHAFSGGKTTDELECTISTKTLTITADDKTMYYSASAPTYTYTSSGLISGDTITGTAKYTIKNGNTEVTNVSTASAGTYDIHVSGLSAINYKITYETGTLTINNNFVTPSASCSNKVYNGTKTATCTISLTGVKTGDTVTASATSCTFADKNVGTNKTVTCTGISLSGANASKYTLSTTTATDTANITEKTLTITAENKTMIYGESAPTYTYTYSGLISGDTITGTAKYTIKSGSTEITNVSTASAGTYDIHVSGLTAANYTITYVKGTLTISKITVTASASCSDKVYDGTNTATCTISLTGVKSGDTVTASATNCAFADKNVGTNKTVTCTGISLSGTNSSKYTLSSSTATDTANITEKTLTITAENKTMNYGESAPTYTYTYSGLLSGETITGTAQYTIKSGSTEVTNVSTVSAGTYDIHVSGLSATNYTITYVKGTLTIIRPTYKVKFYGNGGTLDSTTYAEITVYSGESVTLPAYNSSQISKAHSSATYKSYNGTSYYDAYNFKGWATSSTGSAEYCAESTITNITSDINLYAVWELVYPTVQNPKMTNSNGDAIYKCLYKSNAVDCCSCSGNCGKKSPKVSHFYGPETFGYRGRITTMNNCGIIDYNGTIYVMNIESGSLKYKNATAAYSCTATRNMNSMSSGTTGGR